VQRVDRDAGLLVDPSEEGLKGRALDAHPHQACRRSLSRRGAGSCKIGDMDRLGHAEADELVQIDAAFLRLATGFRRSEDAAGCCRNWR
jgi:hypothetical protein